MMDRFASDFLDGHKPHVLVHDKVAHPTNPKQFHYRVQAQTLPPVTGGGEHTTPSKHIHMDLEAELHDSTVELGRVTMCDNDPTSHVAVDGSDTDTDTNTDNSDSMEHVMEVVTFKDVAPGLLDQVTEGAVVIAECGISDSDSDGDIEYVYGRVLSKNMKEHKVVVDTKFKDETEKMSAAFKKFKMQSYAGPTPIQNSRHLGYMQKLGRDPAQFYNDLNERYNRKPVIAMPKPANLRTSPIDSSSKNNNNHHRKLDTLEASVDAEVLFNCDTMTSDSKGCEIYTDESVTLIDHYKITYDGTDIDFSLKCVDCAGTIAGASIYSSIEADYSIDTGLDDVVDAVNDIADGASDVVDDIGDTAGDVWDDASDTVDDVVDTIDDWTPWRRKLQDVDVNIDFEFGGNFEDLTIDFSLLTELQMNPNPLSSLAVATNLFTVYVPNLGVGTSVFGIGLGAGLRVVANVDPDMSLDGQITMQTGAKFVLNGDAAFAGSVGLDGVDLTTNDGGFRVTKYLDTPALTATVGGAFKLTFTLELQCGVWASLADSSTSSGVGAAFYGALGVPLIIDGTVRGTTPGLHTSIPASYCQTSYDASTNFFIGDCTQPNNLQGQVSIYTEDIYGYVYAGATLSIANNLYTKSISHKYSLEQSDLTGYALEFGPYTITYCDCILYDGVDCSITGGGSQCAVDAFPPASERIAPTYTEDSPESGMALAWDQEEIGVIDDQPNWAMIIGIAVACVVVVIIIIGVVFGLRASKAAKRTKVKTVAKKFGGQAKKKGKKKKGTKYAVTNIHASKTGRN